MKEITTATWNNELKFLPVERDEWFIFNYELSKMFTWVNNSGILSVGLEHLSGQTYQGISDLELKGALIK